VTSPNDKKVISNKWSRSCQDIGVLSLSHYYTHTHWHTQLTHTPAHRLLHASTHSSNYQITKTNFRKTIKKSI